MKNISHLIINEFILAIFWKYELPHFLIMVIIKIYHNYFILNGF